MNMKLKLLAGTVLLLCFSQVSMATVTSTVTLNGITHTFTYADQAAAQQAALNPSEAEISFFANPTSPTSAEGLISRSVDSTKPDETVVIIRQTGKDVIVQKIPTTGTGAANSVLISGAGTVTKTNSIVTAYLNDATTTMAANPNTIALATKDVTTFDVVKTATDNAILTVTNAKPSTAGTDAEDAADVAAQAAQITQIKAVESGLNVTMQSTDYVVSTVILNGVSKDYNFSTQEEALAFANDAKAHRGDFNNATTIVGMVTESTYKGQTATLIRTAADTVVVAMPQTDGSIKYTQIVSTAHLNGNVAKFLKGDTTVGTTPPSQAVIQQAIDYVRAAKTVAGVPATIVGNLSGTENGLVALLTPVVPVIDAQLQQTLNNAVNAIGTKEVKADMANALASANPNQEMQNLLNRMKTNKYAARNSRSSGIAGNPISAMNTTVDAMFYQAADYGQGAKANLGSVTTEGGVRASGSATLQYGYYDLDGRTANVVSMPLSMSAKFGSKGELVLTVPLSYIQTQNQTDAYQAGAILGYKFNVNDNWSITPAASYTYRNFDSADWNNAMRKNTSMVGGTVSSKYTWNMQPQGIRVSLTNMVGYIESLDKGAANTVSNYVTKNGLHITKSVGTFMVGAYFTDTEYFGPKKSLYFDQFSEAGFSVKPQGMGSALDALSLDANYLFNIGGNHDSKIDGFRVNLGYKF
jgi:hypothetical protein